MASGCTYSTARLDYERHPELRAVRLWTGRKEVAVVKLGPVEASRGGWLGRDAMATDVSLQLLTNARAMGGAGVIETRYYNPAHWAGRVRCRRNWVFLGHLTVWARGVAVQRLPGSPSE